VGVVGAGVIGLSVAAELARLGARVTVIDPAPIGDNASGVSAGMLAPALESVFDEPARGRFSLLRHGRDLWPAFAEAHGLAPPEPCGSLWIADDLTAASAALRGQDARFELLSAAEAAARAPGVAAPSGAVFTPEDWRLEPAPALALLWRAVEARGGQFVRAAVIDAAAGVLTLPDRSLPFDAVVVAAGFEARRFSSAAPELGLLTPVKGERLRFPGAEPRQGPIVRSASGYVAHSASGAVVGATMEAGADDRRITPAAAASLHAAAAAMFPALAGRPAEQSAGVRAATPDGLPLVGRSARGLLLAAGARRNGWLLAPLVAETIADELAGVQPGPWAAALHPGRF
jgi:glycine oxidase